MFLIILIIVFRGFLFRTFINYSKINVRNNITLTDKNLILKINNLSDGKNMNIQEIINLSNKITSDELSFTFDKVSNNPNHSHKLKKANCIGYSSLFNSIGNYLLNKYHLNKKYEFNHCVGKIYFLQFDIHKLFQSSFFKNHDFNELKNKQTGKSEFIDPSLSDYLNIDRIKCTNL